MTRPTRMLIILGLFGVGSVIALSMMAQRYSKLMPRAEPGSTATSSAAEPAAPSPAGRGATRSIEVQARALRYVDAFIEVRRTLAVGPMADRLTAWSDLGDPLTDEEAEALDRVLASAGLDRSTYLGILDLYGDWKAGREDLTGPLPDAFAQRREKLAALD